MHVKVEGIRQKKVGLMIAQKQKQEEGLTASSRTHVLTKVRLPQRVCCSRPGAMPVQHMRASEQAQDDISPKKNDVTSKSPVGDISVVTLIRTDTTLDHSQKAEKV